MANPQNTHMQQRTAYLLEQYMSGNINEVELSELQQLSEASPQDIQNGIQHFLEGQEVDTAYDAAHWQQVLGRIMNADKQEEVRTIPFYKKPLFRYAAAVLLIITGAGIWYAANQTKSAQPSIPVVAEKNVPPGKDGAILTLADGSQIVLDSMGNGLVTTQKGTHVVLSDGQLTYFSQEKSTMEMLYNTMTTPRGRQFNVTLPDGTRVWLNAASSLRYPTAFTGKERRVEVTGEAYFEVVKNKEQPFKVSIDHKMEVEVLGTSFNVNAYSDEPSINTTLVTGSVKLLPSNQQYGALILKPGQQAQQSTTIHGSDLLPVMRVKEVDLGDVVAWKEGAFAFNDADLPTMMRQLSRWYNVEVEYAGAIPKLAFSGKMGRDLSLADILAELKKDIKFRIEGDNKIVVLP